MDIKRKIRLVAHGIGKTIQTAGQSGYDRHEIEGYTGKAGGHEAGSRRSLSNE
jgi:hypothetical protein